MKVEIVNFYWVSSSFTAPTTPAWSATVAYCAESWEEMEAAPFNGQKRIEAQWPMEDVIANGLTLEGIGEAFSTELAAKLVHANQATETAVNERNMTRTDLETATSRIAALETELAVASERTTAAVARIAELEAAALAHVAEIGAAKAASPPA